MISVTICDSCGHRFDNEINQKMLYWYEIPRPVYIYCNNVNCIIPHDSRTTRTSDNSTCWVSAAWGCNNIQNQVI